MVVCQIIQSWVQFLVARLPYGLLFKDKIEEFWESFISECKLIVAVFLTCYIWPRKDANKNIPTISANFILLYFCSYNMHQVKLWRCNKGKQNAVAIGHWQDNRGGTRGINAVHWHNIGSTIFTWARFPSKVMVSTSTWLSWVRAVCVANVCMHHLRERILWHRSPAQLSQPRPVLIRGHGP